MYGVELYAAVRLAVVDEGLSHHDPELDYRGGQGPIVHAILEAGPPRGGGYGTGPSGTTREACRWAFTSLQRWFGLRGRRYFQDRCDLAQRRPWHYLFEIEALGRRSGTELAGSARCLDGSTESRRSSWLREQISFPWTTRLVRRVGSVSFRPRRLRPVT